MEPDFLKNDTRADLSDVFLFAFDFLHFISPVVPLLFLYVS